MKKYLIFDLDGTLIESMGDSVRIIEEVLSKTIPETDMEKVRYVFTTTAGTPLLTQLEMVYEGMDVNCNYLTKLIYDKLLHLDSVFFPGVPEKIKQLKNEYQLFLTTGNSTQTAYKHLAHAGILDEFEMILGSDQIHKGPQHLDLFQDYTGDEEFFLKSVYIGDGDSDRVFAKGKNIDFIHIGNEKKDTYEIQSVVDIQTVLSILTTKLGE